MTLRRGGCDAAMERHCREEFGDEILSWMCPKCEKKGLPKISEYTEKMFGIRRLIAAGYPFGKNDLSLEEWIDLGLIAEAMGPM
jgi:hypothetical protein